MPEPAPSSIGKPRSAALPWPFLASLSGYTARNLSQDLAAGLTLAAIAIPEQMATARLGGFSPEIGFVAFIAGTLGFAAFGANRFLSVGADSTITPIFGGGLMIWMVVGTPDYAGMAGALALLVGVFLICGGLFCLGWIADLLSLPVTTGFLAGISVHIVVSQLPGLLGLPPPSGGLLHRLGAIAMQLDRANVYCIAIGLSVLCLTLGAEYRSARIPGALIGLLIATAAVVVFGLESHGVSVLDVIPGKLPRLSWPAATLDELLHVVPLALIISAVIMLQTAATTRSFVSDPGATPVVNRDFIGVGAGNILAGLFGAFPVNASPPRTAIVSETGARSQIAGLLAALLVLLLIAFGAKLLAHVPNAALAGVLLFIASRIFHLRAIIEVFHQTFEEFALIMITMVSIVILPIETGVGIGIVLSLIHGVWTTTRANLIEFEKVPGTSIWWAPSGKHKGETHRAILVVAFQAPLSFLNAYSFKQRFLDEIERRPKPLDLVVLEASSIIAIDFTASKILAEVIQHCQSLGVAFSVARLESVRAQKSFAIFGVMELLGEDHFFHSVDEAIQASAKSV